ncbi:uncharacterized protein KY384_005964 [Bacidia gigantensis]|uniref:uncharacterized protein n=1 Tax=Bacidia gigantensis TaxID=2732470 RepID=UPI001D051FAD|nr:uncharacterized protein KY384_005964 [Bacidia gigantensis]KAG8529328.1 hypothetical protein KY384_005964 [Bacidia gigantensis]
MAAFKHSQTPSAVDSFAPHNPRADHAPSHLTHDPQRDRHLSNGDDMQEGNRFQLDFTHNPVPMPVNGHGPGSVQMPSGPTSQVPPPGARHRSGLSMGSYDISKSPPNPKSTSHVPCKFFRIGGCQAGKACPFSHALDNTTDEVCKYFQKVCYRQKWNWFGSADTIKGNCKFGHKCALAHVLPNGRRVNRPNPAARGSMDLSGRIDPQLYSQPEPVPPQSLLTSHVNGPFSQQIPPFSEHDRSMQIPQPRPYGIPSIDTDPASPQYGSPIEGSRLAYSQSNHLNVLDAPLPASFDSQGVSYIARHGPVAASVPSKFGLEFSSPPSSTNRHAFAPSDNLQSAFATHRNPRTRGPELGSSPFTSGDEGPPPRTMHSQRIAKPNMLSASLPKAGMRTDDWDEGFNFSDGEETDYIPSSLHDQILTPQEKLRRSSRNDRDNKSVRESLSGLASPGDSSSIVGSPNAGSPSRYGNVFVRRQPETNSSMGSMGSSPSQFGPVGSPLRSLHPSASPSMRATKDAGDVPTTFPAFASPPRHSSMSILSQQLGRTRLSSKASDSGDKSGNLHPNSARHSSAPTTGFGRSIPSSAQKDRIDEEVGEGVFSMEEEEYDRSRLLNGSNNNAWGTIGSRPSGGWN